MFGCTLNCTQAPCGRTGAACVLSGSRSFPGAWPLRLRVEDPDPVR